MAGKKTSNTTTIKTTKGQNTEKKSKTNPIPIESNRIHEAIRIQAYYNYLHRIMNNLPGDQLSDWLEAEKYIKKTINKQQ